MGEGEPAGDQGQPGGAAGSETSLSEDGRTGEGASQEAFSGWRGVVETAYLPLTVATSAALAIAAVWGLPLVAVAGLGVAVALDTVASFQRPPEGRLLDRLGVGSRTRAMIRSLVTAVMFGVAGGAEASAVVTYGAVAVTAHASWVLFLVLVNRATRGTPALAHRNLDLGVDLPEILNRVRRGRGIGPYVLLMLEWAAVLWLALLLRDGGADSAAIVAVGAVAVLAMLLVVTAAGVWSIRFIRSGLFASYDRALYAQLEALAPEAIVYMSAGPGQSRYILNQWLPAFDRMDKRAIIVVREYSQLEPIAATTLPIVYARATRDLERLVLPSIKLAFYLANAGKNVHLLREPAIKHVFLNHGDSDKSTSANPVSRVYDEVWVAGEAAMDRYEAAGVMIPPEHFAVVGRPQVDGLTVGPRQGDARRRVLYGPTFEGYYEESNYSSLEVMGPEMITRIVRERPDVGVIFKPHPATGRQRPGMTQARREVMRILQTAPNAKQHVIAEFDPSITLYDCFEMADVLISDVSSVVTDFLHTERPIITSNPKGLTREEFVETFPTQASSYILDRHLDGLIEMLDQALGDDPLAAQRKEMKRYVLGDLPAGPLETFAQNVNRIYDQAVIDAGKVRNAFTFSSERMQHSRP